MHVLNHPPEKSHSHKSHKCSFQCFRMLYSFHYWGIDLISTCITYNCDLSMLKDERITRRHLFTCILRLELEDVKNRKNPFFSPLPYKYSQFLTFQRPHFSSKSAARRHTEKTIFHATRKVFEKFGRGRSGSYRRLRQGLEKMERE